MHLHYLLSSTFSSSAHAHSLDTLSAETTSSDNAEPSHSADKHQTRWHPFHSDPNDDIVIQSEEGVFFRASSYHLAQARYVARLDIVGINPHLTIRNVHTVPT
jgi:hypothetical protein